jgi:glutathione S-transferase
LDIAPQPIFLGDARSRALPLPDADGPPVRAEVEELTGQTTVPVLVIDGDAICDSRRIAEHLAWREDERQRARSVEHGTPARR